MKKAYPLGEKKKKRIKIKLTVEENLHYSATEKWKTEFRQIVCHDWHWSDLLEVRHEILKQLCVLFKFLNPFFFPFGEKPPPLGRFSWRRLCVTCLRCSGPPCLVVSKTLHPFPWLAAAIPISHMWWEMKAFISSSGQTGTQGKDAPHVLPKSISAPLLYSLTLPGPHGSSGQPTQPNFMLSYWCGLSLREIPELLHT